jgi:hypothetical protein
MSQSTDIFCFSIDTTKFDRCREGERFVIDKLVVYMSNLVDLRKPAAAAAVEMPLKRVTNLRWVLSKQLYSEYTEHF